MVVNVNLRALIHNDVGDDQENCAVFVLSDCIAGELCFKELGVVLALGSGDFVIFRSKTISHFNLHFEGIRFSFVFHTDSHYQLWRGKDDGGPSRNGWSENIYFNSSDFSSLDNIRLMHSVPY